MSHYSNYSTVSLLSRSSEHRQDASGDVGDGRGTAKSPGARANSQQRHRVPGVGFGSEGYARFSFATDIESIRKGIKRIEEFVKELKA